MYMNLLTTTELRTKTSELVNLLLSGNEVTIVHRSKIIGTIKPKYEGKPFNAKTFTLLSKKLNLPILSETDRMANYRSHIAKKYVKDIS